MAHKIDTSVAANGAAVYAMLPAWHELGTVLDHAFTSEEALSQAGLNFTVEKLPAGYIVNGVFHPSPSRYMLTRSDTGATLGTCQEKYDPLQMSESFAAMDEIFRGEGAVYEAAGVLEGGAKVWLLARLPGDEQITSAPGDTLRRYGLLTTGNDGLTSTSLLATTTRVVCYNTLQAALRASKDTTRIIHSTSQRDRLAAAGQAFREANVLTREVAELARKLAGVPARDADVTKSIDFTLDWFVGSEVAPDGKLITRRANRRAVDGATLLENIVTEQMLCGGNMWALFNGVTRYTDHALPYRGANAGESRFKSLMGGDVTDFKAAYVEQVCGANMISGMVA